MNKNLIIKGYGELHIKHNLKNIRKLNNLTQLKLAKMLNLSEAAYCRKENGARQFTLEEAKKLALIFNTSIEEIF